MVTPCFKRALLLVVSALLVPGGLAMSGHVAVAASATEAQGVGHVHALLVHPKEDTSKDDTLLVGTHHGLWRSPDAGVTWEHVTPKGEVPGSDFMALAMHPQQHDQLYAGGHDLGVLRSDDFGQTWQRASQGLPSPDVHALTVDPHKPQQLYAWVVEHGLYRSQDSGRTWHRVNDGPPNPEVRALASVNIPTGMGGIFLYAGTADGIFKSPD
jgi:photosystem II stability/assembly factor-like uncharacterized protein